jgi:polyisoprenyl-phosphate glycosyltransferase
VGKIYKESKQRPKFIIDIDTFSMPLTRHHLIRNNTEEEFYTIEHRKVSETN